jgi:hypothetical protein
MFRRLGDLHLQADGVSWAPQMLFSRALSTLPISFTGS